MGPDEFATREELGVMLKYAFAKLGQQAEFFTQLMSLLQDKGILTNQEIIDFGNRLRDSRLSKRAAERLAKLNEFAAIHSVARQYLDPLDE